MNEKKERMIVNGNEFYEIDLECMKRRQEGKECIKGTDRRGEKNVEKRKNRR